MPFEFPIEAGQIMLFAARSVTPTRCMPIPTLRSHHQRSCRPSAHYDPEYPLRPRIGEPWFGSGKEATGGSRIDAPDGGDGGGTSLHAEQHFTYHRPLRPGDVLTVETREGKTWEKQGKRAGTLRFRELITEYRDATGELVVTARLVGVRTQRPVGDATT